MYTGMKQAGLIGAACCGIASAQGTITYFWDINDTGSDTYLYTQGEDPINFKLYALMAPEQVGFAASTYEILGSDDYADGMVVNYTNRLGFGTGDGDLQGNNDILNIEAFQLAPFFNPDFDTSNPILLYEIDWEAPDGLMIARLTSANHLNNAVYIDDLNTESYNAITTIATVYIPAPASVLPLVGLLAWRRRR